MASREQQQRYHQRHQAMTSRDSLAPTTGAWQIRIVRFARQWRPALLLIVGIFCEQRTTIVLVLLVPLCASLADRTSGSSTMRRYRRLSTRAKVIDSSNSSGLLSGPGCRKREPFSLYMYTIELSPHFASIIYIYIYPFFSSAVKLSQEKYYMG